MNKKAGTTRQTGIHIGAWVSPKPAQKVGGEDFCTLEQYQLLKESGIRAAYAIYERSAVDIDGKNANERALEHAEKAGVLFYVWDTTLRERMLAGDRAATENYLKKYTKFKSFYGVIVKDEPNKEDLDWCKKIVDVWDSYLPDKDCFINFFPSHVAAADCKLSEGETFEKDYVGAFMQLDIKRVSYDLYPLLYDDDGNPTIQKDYLYNLEFFAEEAKKKGVPLWTFIQSMSYSRWHRHPDEAALRWQIMNAFAYGAKGIQHFCYWPPTEDSLLTVNEAFLTPKGEPTQIYFDAQKIHREIAKFEKTFVQFDYEGVLPVVGEGLEENAQYKTLKNPLKSHALVKQVQATQDTLVGVLKNERGENALFISNFADPVLHVEDSVSITLQGVQKIAVVQGGVKRIKQNKDGKFRITLQAGDGAFITLKK